MRLVYSLIASGLLVLTEVPAEQPPPQVVYQDLVYMAGMKATTSQFTVSYVASDALIDQPGEWYFTSSPDSILSLAHPSFPAQSKQETFEMRQPLEVASKHLQDGLEMVPIEPKEAPTAYPPTAYPTALPSAAYNDNGLATYRQSSLLPAAGYAMFYNPNVMQVVENNRLAMGHISSCTECIGSVALLRAGDLNRHVWLEWADGVVDGPYLVADVAALQHIPQLMARKWVVDVDNGTAVRHGMRGPVWVTVWGTPPNRGQQVTQPFAPLYSTFPTETPASSNAPFTEINDPAFATSIAMKAGLSPLQATPMPTPSPTLITMHSTLYVPVQETSAIMLPTAAPLAVATPTITPLPVLNSSTTANSPVQVGFPTDTPVPTQTALPALNASSQAPFVATPASSPTRVFPAGIVATPTLIATYTSLPTETAAPTYTSTLTPTPALTQPPAPTQARFPADTPVPTITPLPAIK